jgi:formate hydrogenlyase subunit 6/NADH:ubiquinone oxidoreductase subunit I
LTRQEHDLERERRQTFGAGLAKGLGVTLKHLFKHNTVIQYPDQKQDLPPRTRGVIALKEENCTVCMLCARECPDWCIYIDSHKETLPPKREGGRPRKRNVLDRFAIDYALCMYCGICVQVCPYDALFWSREFEYAEYDIRELTHEKEKLSDWMATVLPPPALEEGAELPGDPATAAGAAGPGTAQRPSPPSQATATEVRPQQAARAPEPAATSAPPPSQATTSQVQAGETQPEEASAVAEPTEQTTDARADEPVAERAEEVRVPEGDHPEAIRTPDEQVPAPRAEVEAPVEQVPATRPEAATPLGPGGTEAGEAAYREVLDEQLAQGASPQVAEARARVARVKAERGLRPQAPAAAAPAAPTGAAAQAEPSEPEAQTEAPAPAAEAPAPAEPSDPEAPAVASEPQPAADAAAGEDPDAAYERVLADERAKGSSDAVAVVRAKAARARAQERAKGSRG